MRKIYVIEYQHRHGCDLSAYATEAQADAVARSLALEYWEQELGEPAPATGTRTDADLVAEYNNRCSERGSDEWISIHDLILWEGV